MPVGTITLDETFLKVAKVQTFANEQPLTNATGLFYLQDAFLYLLTARHVILDERGQHYPNRLQVSLHSDAADLRKNVELSIPLYVQGRPQWYQHPLHPEADLAAVCVNDAHVLSRRVVAAFRRADVVRVDEVVPMGQDVLIPGFPLGFHDTLHNLPILRRATMASSFSHPFKGSPYFLTDARLHRGMSGSPVIVRSPLAPNESGDPRAVWRLLGIHTSALDVSDRDPNRDERLGLNMAWYASLIPEMLPARRPVPSGALRIFESEIQDPRPNLQNP